MSYDLDLRSPVYISRELFHKKRSLIKFLLISLIFSPFFFYYGLYHYHQLLATQATALEREMIILRQEAEPMLNMTSELENIDSRKQVIDQLVPVHNKWSTALHLLHTRAPAQITITGIEITPGGSIKIDGTSSNMHAPARYRQNLSSVPIFGLTELNILTLHSDQNYTFKITTQLSTGDGLDDNTENFIAQ